VCAGILHGDELEAQRFLEALRADIMALKGAWTALKEASILQRAGALVCHANLEDPEQLINFMCSLPLWHMLIARMHADGLNATDLVRAGGCCAGWPAMCWYCTRPCCACRAALPQHTDTHTVLVAGPVCCRLTTSRTRRASCTCGPG
jgi:hypothetical protein